MPSTFNKIPRTADATLPSSSSETSTQQGESENDLEAILLSLLGSEKGMQKMKELQAKDKLLTEAAEGSTTVPSESEDVAGPQPPQGSLEEGAYVLESAQAKSSWSPPPPLPPLSAAQVASYSQVASLPAAISVAASLPPPAAPGPVLLQGTGLMYAPWAKGVNSNAEPSRPLNTQQLQAQSQLQAQRVLGSRCSEKSKGHSWTLAWCADFKRVNIHSSLKDQLHTLVTGKGGVVVPFWSARGLSKWLQSNGNVPYVMLADLSVLDMSIRSTTLHHRKEKISKKPVHIFVTSYDDNAEEVRSTPAAVQSVPTSVVSFNEFGLRDMASQAVLMLLGLS